MTVVALKTDKTSEPIITLRQRVADALTKDTTSGEVRACIAHTQADFARVERDLASAKARAVDPLASEEEATAAKRECENLGFDRERLEASQRRLTARLAQIEDDEAQSGLQATYDEVHAERAALIVEMREQYPKLAGGLMALLTRMQTVEHRIAEANNALPRGASRLSYIENTLSEPLSYGPNLGSAQVPPLYASVQLPRLIRTGGNDDFLKISLRNTHGVLPY
ncbi:hypothetical protein [Methylobacterium dankookense]|uniref:Uncharacterized protein n=1 Tax=Methylobacterium dankookense TaxID=560405 RepID=A0A564G208_9HYPH|nr:hypothetical protein [Methylobacterium dankookense]GJD58259.1 hypothetical protein IFDJLNFL_4176 [Methylobacterium dankookense]VUF14172.1 hypothetical protein MTDSW087_03888 [Methylobacterium dankookense]